MSLRILIVDDQTLFREGLKTLCTLQPDLEVVDTAGDGQEALEKVAACRPDVVLMDVRMPVMDGVEATRRIRADHPAVAVIVLTTYNDDEYVQEALAAGAAGYLLKDSPPPMLFAAIHAVQSGGTFISPAVAERLVTLARGQEVAPTREGRTPPAAASEIDLTAREWEVLELIAEGLSNREIARRLYLTEGTVKNYISTVYAKLGTNDRVRAALAARELRRPPGAGRSADGSHEGR